jgi:hypothetical protein
MTANGVPTRSRGSKPDLVSVEEVVARVAALTTRVEQAEQQLTERAPAGSGEVPGGGDEGQGPLYSDVEAWVNTYLLPTFPRPFDTVGVTRWYWCAQWWAHDEAVTRFMALWYAWESARLEMTGMVGWLQLLDQNLPILCGEDGPFRACNAGKVGHAARHVMSPIAATEKAPPDWWDLWN